MMVARFIFILEEFLVIDFWMHNPWTNARYIACTQCFWIHEWMDPWMDTLSQEPRVFRLRSWVWSFPRRLSTSITFPHTLLYEICWILFFTTYFEYLPCAIPFWIFFFFTMNSFSREVFLYPCPPFSTTPRQRLTHFSANMYRTPFPHQFQCYSQGVWWPKTEMWVLPPRSCP